MAWLVAFVGALAHGGPTLADDRATLDIAEEVIKKHLNEDLDLWSRGWSDVLATFFRGATPASVEPFLDNPQLLHQAARYTDSAEIITYLIDSGFDPNIQAPFTVNDDSFFDSERAGLGSLHYAAMDNPNPSIVEALLSGGADVHAVGGLLLERPLHFAAGNNNAAVVLALIRNGADVDAVNGRVRAGLFRSPNLNGNRALHGAACNDDASVVDALVYAGADLASTNASGFAALHLAVLCKNAGSVSALLMHGTDANTMVEFVEEGDAMHDCTGCSSIHLLVNSLVDERGSKDGVDLAELEPIFAMLVDAGASVDSRVESRRSWALSAMYAGYSPLRLAVEAELGPTVVAFLLEFGARAEPASLHALFQETFQYAGSSAGAFDYRSIGSEDDLRVLDLLLEKEIDVNGRDKCGRTPLLRAASLAPRDDGGIERLIGRLIAAGADVNARLQDRIQELEDNGLVEMTDTGVVFEDDVDDEVLEIVGECGESVDWAFTPLHAAARHGGAGYTVASMLLAAGADASVANRRGKTAADIATNDRMKALLGGK